MTIQYDGTQFFGWQVQAEGRTVQGDIEAILQDLHPRKKITLNGSGRTDSGVHALGQVANIKLETTLKPDNLSKALNSKLNKDVHITDCNVVNEDFHARFSAKERRYEYHIVDKPTPFNHNRAWCMKYEVDFDIIQSCAEMVIGDHDFTAFCKATAEVGHKHCIVYESQWEKTTNGLVYHVKANRFLQHMVRFLVGTMIEVGRGRMTINDFKQFMEGSHLTFAVMRAPAHGLYLAEVTYG